MKTFMFHLMPYAPLDMTFDQTYSASSLVLPNSYYDPVQGHELYNRYLDELEFAAELGFDGIAVNEHHQSAYGLMPSPVVIASALARRTKTCKIAILGNAFGLREHPLTLAEEHAMLDVITGGRLISGMVRGLGTEYYAFGVNPAFSLERFREAHDLVVEAWTRPGPFAFEGKHYRFEYVNVWPRPFQQPHPPIWCPSTGSAETIEWTTHPSRKYTYMQIYSPLESVGRFLNQYRETARRVHGYEANSQQLGWAAPTYVAETDERARDEARYHFESLFNKFLPASFEQIFPPGYLTLQSLKRLRTHKRSLTGNQGFDALLESGVILCGSPDTVTRKLTQAHRSLGFQNFVALLQFGTLPRDLTQKNIELFAREVRPALAALTDHEYQGMSAA